MAQASKGIRLVLLLLAVGLIGLLIFGISNFISAQRKQKAELFRAEEVRRTEERLKRLEAQIKQNNAHLVNPKSKVGQNAYSSKATKSSPIKQFLCHEPEERCYYIVNLFSDGRRESHRVVEGSVVSLARFGGRADQNVRIESNGNLTPTTESERVGIRVKGDDPKSVQSTLMPLPEADDEGNTRVHPKYSSRNEPFRR